MVKKIEIGIRLKEFADKNFKSIADFARHFGKSRNFFTPYFNGSSVPGGEILTRLADLGCDINWLLTGEKSIIKEPSQQYIHDVTQSGAGDQFAGNIKGKEVDFKSGTKDNAIIIEHLYKIIEQKDKMIQQLLEQIEITKLKK